MAQISDREILGLFKEEATRRKAFSLLVEKYQRRLYWMIRRLVIDHADTDDILQNTLIKVWGSLDGFRGDSRLFSWLYRIAYNEAITFLKRKRKALGLQSDAFSEFMENIVDENCSMDCPEIERKLQKALLRLPEMQRVVFQLRYFDHMSYEDISEITKSTTNSLKTSYHFATKKIEKYLLED